MSTHLVIGASGQIGEHLVSALDRAGEAVIGTYHQVKRRNLRCLDIRDAQAVDSLIASVQPAVIHLPAALTHVDHCELHPDEAYSINVLGVHHVIRAAQRLKAKVVYFSSDYIFDGRSGPYREEDPANPISEYGRQKLAAEHLVMLQAPEPLVIRTTVVYGWDESGKNFVSRLIRSLCDGLGVSVPVDQVGSPTYAPDLTQVVVDLVRAGRCGVYHVAGPERVNRYEFALAAAQAFGLDATGIRPVSTANLNQPAPRPLNAGMIVDRAQSVLQRSFVGYKAGLCQMAAEYAR
jgi:dTDP-4-dehydrorhamnose reductase